MNCGRHNSAHNMAHASFARAELVQAPRHMNREELLSTMRDNKKSMKTASYLSSSKDGTGYKSS